MAQNIHFSIFRWINFYTFQSLGVWIWNLEPLYQLQNNSGYDNVALSFWVWIRRCLYHDRWGYVTTSQFQDYIPQLKISAAHPLGLEIYVKNCDIVTWDVIFWTNLPMKLGRNNVVMFLRETEKRKAPYLNLSCNNSRY